MIIDECAPELMLQLLHHLLSKLLNINELTQEVLLVLLVYPCKLTHHLIELPLILGNLIFFSIDYLVLSRVNLGCHLNHWLLRLTRSILGALHTIDLPLCIICRRSLLLISLDDLPDRLTPLLDHVITLIQFLHHLLHP